MSYPNLSPLGTAQLSWGHLQHHHPELSFKESQCSFVRFRFRTVALSQLLYNVRKSVSLFMAFNFIVELDFAPVGNWTPIREGSCQLSAWKLLAMGFSNTLFVGLAQHILSAVRRGCLLMAGKG